MIWNTSETVCITSHLCHSHFLLLIAANLALAGFLGWNWSSCPVPTWLAVQRSKAVFFLTLYDSINDMKNFLTVCITPHPCHIHFCCWLLPILPKLDLYTINDMKHFRTLYIAPYRALVCFHPYKKALSPSVSPGLGPSDLLTAVVYPVHFHPPPSYAMLVGRSPLALNRHTAVIMWTAPIPRHGRGHGPSLPWLLTTGACDIR